MSTTFSDTNPMLHHNMGLMGGILQPLSTGPAGVQRAHVSLLLGLAA
jgi:hypothetical protein